MSNTEITGNITLLNVGDGDAILVHLVKGPEELIMVVDGGQKRYYTDTLKPALEELLEKTSKQGPDIVVVTHYDSDHIAGLIPLMEDFKEHVKEVWVHQPPEFSLEENEILEDYARHTNVKGYEQYLYENELILSHPNYKEEAIKEKTEYILESITQLKTFIGEFPASLAKQVYAGYSPEGWPEIRVLGPTEEYFSKLFPPEIELSELILDQTIAYVNESMGMVRRRETELMIDGQPPCNFLKDDSSARISPTNKASIIFTITNDDKKYLFTGDAGIDSFKNIPEWKDELKELFWLKIPHHGSDNNLSKEIVNIMQPEYADNTGDKYEDEIILQCIGSNPRNKRAVRSTKTEGSLEFGIV